MANSSSNSSRIASTPTTTLTTTAQLTTTTTGFAAPTPTVPLNRDCLVQVLVRIDKFAALHAIAVTCKGWNENWSAVFQWFRNIARSEDALKLSERCKALDPLPASKAVSFALAYLESRLRNHRATEGPANSRLFSRNIVNLIGEQPANQRVASALSMLPSFNGLFNADWKRMLTLVREGMSNDEQLNLFRLLACRHSNAERIFFKKLDLASEVQQTERLDSNLHFDERLVETCKHNPALLDALFQKALDRGEKSEPYRNLKFFMARQNCIANPEDSILTPATCLRWLQLAPPYEIQRMLVTHLVTRSFPEDCYTQVLDCVTAFVSITNEIDQTRSILERLRIRPQFEAIMSSDRVRLKQFVRAVAKLDRDLLARNDSATGHFNSSLASALANAGIATHEEIRAWSEQD